MVTLVKEMGISETVGPELNTLVSKMLESMYGKAFRLESGAPAYFEIDWSERTHKADSFQVIPIDIAGSKETDWVSDELVGVGFPEAEMTYDVVLTYSEGSYSVECPALKGLLLAGGQRGGSSRKHQGSHYRMFAAVKSWMRDNEHKRCWTWKRRRGFLPK